MGWPHRLRSKRSGEPGSEKNLSREECAQRRGNCFRWKVATIKPKAQPPPRQDSQQDKDVQADRPRMETWPTRHPRATASPACALTRARPTTKDKGENAPAVAGGNVLEAWRGSSIGMAVRRVGEPSFVTTRQRTASVGDGTLSHNLPQQT
jgi:hypothetical protein